MSDMYVLAVRRESRDSIAPDWVARVRAMDGVRDVTVDAKMRRAVVQATAEAIGRIEVAFGDDLIVEPAGAYGVAR